MTDSERTTYKANCHCGAVRYSITLNNPFPKNKVNRCTCSICTKNGYELIYPLRPDVVFHQGYQNMTDYKFGDKNKSHLFCKTCGSSIGIDFRAKDRGIMEDEKDRLALNVRMIQDIDLSKMEWTYFDGKNLLTPAYNIAE